MDLDERVLEDGTPDIAAGDVIANLGRRCELPLLGSVESGEVDSARDVDALGLLRDLLEGPLDSIVDVL